MRDLAIKTNKVDNLLSLRLRLRDVVPTAKVFLDKVYQDTHQVSGILNLNPGYKPPFPFWFISLQWLIQLMEGIGKELSGAAKDEWLDLTNMVLQPTIQCRGCQRVSRLQPTPQNCLSLPMVGVTFVFLGVINCWYGLVEHVYSKLKPCLKVYDENGHPRNLEKHVDEYFSDNLDGRVCEPGCGHKGANQYSSIEKHSQVVVTPMILT